MRDRMFHPGVLQDIGPLGLLAVAQKVSDMKFGMQDLWVNRYGVTEVIFHQSLLFGLGLPLSASN